MASLDNLTYRRLLGNQSEMFLGQRKTDDNGRPLHDSDYDPIYSEFSEFKQCSWLIVSVSTDKKTNGSS